MTLPHAWLCPLELTDNENAMLGGRHSNMPATTTRQRYSRVHRNKTLAHSTYLKSSVIRGGVGRLKSASPGARIRTRANMIWAGHSYLKSSAISGGVKRSILDDRWTRFIPVDSCSRERMHARRVLGHTPLFHLLEHLPLCAAEARMREQVGRNHKFDK